jgi:hypothetical protein
MRPLVVALAHVACGGSASTKKDTFTWPVPTGWKSETIPFPLEFAPSIAQRGVEELRFMPRFFEPDAPTFWSYAFVWLLEDAPAASGPWLERSLVAYFQGLGAAVAGDKYQFDPARWRATVTATGDGVFEGAFAGYEPFKTGAPIDLRLELAVRPCGARTAVLVAASPRPADDPVWPELRRVVATFRCD